MFYGVGEQVWQSKGVVPAPPLDVQITNVAGVPLIARYELQASMTEIAVAIFLLPPVIFPMLWAGHYEDTRVNSAHVFQSQYRHQGTIYHCTVAQMTIISSEEALAPIAQPFEYHGDKRSRSLYCVMHVLLQGRYHRPACGPLPNRGAISCMRCGPCFTSTSATRSNIKMHLPWLMRLHD